MRPGLTAEQLHEWCNEYFFITKLSLKACLIQPNVDDASFMLSLNRIYYPSLKSVMGKDHSRTAWLAENRYTTVSSHSVLVSIVGICVVVVEEHDRLVRLSMRDLQSRDLCFGSGSKFCHSGVVLPACRMKSFAQCRVFVSWVG